MDEMAKHFAELAEKFGPRVADAAMGAARAEAFSCLASSVIWVLLSLGFFLGGRFLWRKKSDDDEIFGLFGGAAIGISALLLLPAIWAWVDPWTWITIQHPELWIAKRAFHL